MNSTYRERIRDMVFNYTRGDRDGNIEAEEIIALIQEVAKSAKPEKVEWTVGEELHKYEITIELKTGMMDLDSEVQLLVSGLLKYYKNNWAEIDHKELAIGLRYVADVIEAKERKE